IHHWPSAAPMRNSLGNFDRVSGQGGVPLHLWYEDHALRTVSTTRPGNQGAIRYVLRLTKRVPLPLRRSALMPSGLPLLVQERVEHGLLYIHLVLASRAVDEGVPRTLLDIRVCFLHVVLSRVCTARHF